MIMEYQRAKQAADYLLKQLKPHCEKIEIAGSIRRLKQTGIKDVELVAIPKTEKSGLFGNSETRSDGFIKAVRSLGTIVKRVPKSDEYRTAATDPATANFIQVQGKSGIILDLFIAPPENWGMVFLIRTGPADFGGKIMGKMNKWGYTAAGSKHPDRDWETGLK